MRSIFLILLPVLCSLQARAENDRFDQSLNDAVQSAKLQSGSLHSSQAMKEAASFNADAAGASLWPNLTIQGNYFYQTVVPSLNLGPAFGNKSFGTNNNYSIGPALNYTLFDAGKNSKFHQNAEFLAKSKDQTYHAQEAQLELSIRQAYFRVQYALRALDLTIDSLRLSQAQSQDITVRFKAGAASKLDEVQARRDLINYQLRFQQSQSTLSSSFRDLMALEGDHRELDVARPLSVAAAGAKLPEGVETPTIKLNLEPLETSLASLSQNWTFAGEAHPETQALEAQAQASKKLADSSMAGLYPKLVLQAKAAYEYPNLVLPENVWQETFGAAISFPLFEDDLSRNQARDYNQQAVAAREQKEQRLTDLTRDEGKAHDALQSLQTQKKLSSTNVGQAREVEKLTYYSYRAGKSRYLDVQDANVKLLEAEVLDAQIDSEILNQFAILSYLSTR